MSALCKVCQVSKSGFYGWKNRRESARAKSGRILSVKISELFKLSRSTYGAIRIKKELDKQAISCSKNRVARLMRQLGLKSIHRRKFKVYTTDSKHNLPIASNVINQDFTASAVNQKWGSDITYIETTEGWLYLAIVVDFYSRRIIGWAFDTCLHAKLACNALEMALFRRKSPTRLIHHSDRGVQYASSQYTKILDANNFAQSMSRSGNCYDNAPVESCFHTVKVEGIYQFGILGIDQTKNLTIDYIENFYNSTRLHSSLDYLSPCEYESINRRAA